MNSEQACFHTSGRRCQDKKCTDLAPDRTTVEVFITLLLADPGHFPLESHRAVKCAPPKGDGRVRENLQLFRFSAGNVPNVKAKMSGKYRAGVVSEGGNVGKYHIGSRGRE